MSNRRYAQGTSVSYHKSREEIAKLLENWKATGVQWTDQWAPEPRFQCRFQWIFRNAEGVDIPLMARFELRCDEKLLIERSIDGRNGEVSESKYDKNKKQWVKESHRLLLLVLKAMFNAIESGLFTAEEIFAPFIEHQSGFTVGQILSQHLEKLSSVSTMKLLTGGQ